MLPFVFGLYVLMMFFVVGAISGVISGLIATQVLGRQYSGGLRDAALGGAAFVGTLFLFVLVYSSHMVRPSDSPSHFILAFLAATIAPVLQRLIPRRRVSLNVVDSHDSAAGRDRIRVATAGAVFLLLTVVIVVLIPTPTRVREQTLLVGMALAAGAAGAFLPGAISREGKRPPAVVRATGAIGFAALVILIFRWIA